MCQKNLHDDILKVETMARIKVNRVNTKKLVKMNVKICCDILINILFMNKFKLKQS